MRPEVQRDLQPYWSFRDKIVVIDGIIMKGKRIIIVESPQGNVLNQLHINHMSTEKTGPLAYESIY